MGIIDTLDTPEKARAFIKALQGPDYNHENLGRLLIELSAIDWQFHQRKGRGSDAWRNGRATRVLVMTALLAVLKCIGPRSDALMFLLDALSDAHSGRINPIFATSEDEAGRASATGFNRKTQADAAALLSYGCCDFQMKQAVWGKQIISKLSDAGFRKQTSGQAFGVEALRKWRNSCLNGTHPQSLLYHTSLASYRSLEIMPLDGLRNLADECRAQLGGK